MFALLASYQENLSLSFPTVLTDTVDPGGSQASVSWQFYNNGNGQAFAGPEVISAFTWLFPNAESFADNYEMSEDLTQSTPPVFTIWTPLTSTYVIAESRPAGSGFDSGTRTMGIRRRGTTNPPKVLVLSYSLQAGTMTATISPTFVSGSTARAGAGSATVVASPTVVVTPSSGVAPYTYLWGYVSGVAAGFSLPSTGSSMAFFRNMTVGIGETKTETGFYRCTVTDNIGNIFVTTTVEVETTLTETS